MCVTPAPELSTPSCDPIPILPMRPGVRRAPLLGIASDAAGGLAISAPGQNAVMLTPSESIPLNTQKRTLPL